jgi:hypothetical protein
MQMSGMGIGALMMPSVPVIGSPVAAEHLLEPWIDAAAKRKAVRSRAECGQEQRRYLYRCTYRTIPSAISVYQGKAGSEYCQCRILWHRDQGDRQWYLGIFGNQRRDAGRHCQMCCYCS